MAKSYMSGEHTYKTVGERMHRSFVVGIGGPVGSGKTTCLENLCRILSNVFSVAAITNDVYTDEDAQYMREHSNLPESRIVGVRTGGCPHTAIREDASVNLSAIYKLEENHPDLNLIFLESGGDNLTSSFSPELTDMWIFVIDVGEGDKIPRKGGPGVLQSDILVINKTDLAPYVGADLDVMRSDSLAQRGSRPFVFISSTEPEGYLGLADLILRQMQEKSSKHMFASTE